MRTPGRAMIYGTGLIGGSVGMALRERGWWVSGSDAAPGVAARAVELGALSEEAIDHRPTWWWWRHRSTLPARSSPNRVLPRVEPRCGDHRCRRVKGPLVACRRSPTLRRGSPDGRLRTGRPGWGVRRALRGATWVLTPTSLTDSGAYTQVRNVLADLGANVVALAPAQHDALVAVVSHVPTWLLPP